MTTPEPPLQSSDDDDGDALAALADVRAGRLVDSDQVARRFGGWPLAMLDSRAAPGAAAFSAARDGVTPVAWTESAVAECERIRAILAGMNDEAGQRFAAVLLATLIRLIVDGHPGPPGIATIPVFPTLSLRLLTGDGRLIVLDLHPTAAIT
ncbi:hypothetical protein [Sphingomonas sp. CLY1604]|uniref:hypothetical protein n=1 Tax=Sphingomonas sp. CLY1604 TaxID=3457786 RepID=UPI003FD81E71